MDHRIIGVETIYQIRDTQGKLIAEHVRIDYPDGSKAFYWRRDGRRGLGGLSVNKLPLYGFHSIKDDPTEDIVVTEGEKPCDALHRAGVNAVATVCGAATSPSSEALSVLSGKTTGQIILWPDNDETGRSHMIRIAECLDKLGITSSILTWPQAPYKGDAFDFIEMGGDIHTLLRDNSYVCIYRSGHYKGESKRDKNGTDIGTFSFEHDPTRLSRFGESPSGINRTDAGHNSGQEPLSERVLVWVRDTSGWWETHELDDDLGIKNHRDKDNRRKVLQRLREQGIIERHPTINKRFRFVNTRTTSLDFRTATNGGILPIKWPLGIEDYVNIFPGNIAVIAGSPNAGKTAFLLNFIYHNQDRFPIYYFCSEMGAVELRDRLDKFPDMDIRDWKFEALERSTDFEDVIRPDCINIVDYLEMTTELFSVNTHLTAIHARLCSGIAVIALQKKLGSSLGRGAEFSLEKPKLYISLDRHKLQIVKGKSWSHQDIDPNGIQTKFKIVNGCQFRQTSDWDHDKK